MSKKDETRQPWHPDGDYMATVADETYAIFRSKDGFGSFYWTRLGSRGLDENVNLYQSSGRFYGHGAYEKARHSALMDAEKMDSI